MKDTLRQKLLLLILPLCLIPLVGISFFSYYQAKERITEDRIALYLEQIAQGVANTIRLSLVERQEEIWALRLFFREYMINPEGPAPRDLLDEMVQIHEVYDLLILFDVEGRILLMNMTSRDSGSQGQPSVLDREQVEALTGQDLTRFTPDKLWLREIRADRPSFIDWHESTLIGRLYSYQDEDVALRSSIGFAVPIHNEKGIVIGGVLGLMNWEYVQEILDFLEEEFENRSLPSGYGFLFDRDGDTIIGHKYRRNRILRGTEAGVNRNNYGTSLIVDHGLTRVSEVVQDMLRDPVVNDVTHVGYEYPPGTVKISGLAEIDHEYFNWVCGVGMNDEDIFSPVQELKNVLIAGAVLTSLLVVLITFWAARQFTTPLKELTATARRIARGDSSRRASISSRDEIGELADTFNNMADSLEERSQALIDLNRSLEEKVLERTGELEESHRTIEEAYEELKEAHVQLVQSEKMASLGQLVAGIAHEIKNPLNFIYGNTDFLKQYVEELKTILHMFEKHANLTPTGARAIEDVKQEKGFEFIMEDLGELIKNFEEGARRIHEIIGDLRAFSRMDSDELRPIDIHEPIELALNLVRHEYRDRIDIHKQYEELPSVPCHSGKISQVFMNLLTNACQAILGQGDIWIRTLRRNGHAVIEVKDNGVGISTRHLNRIFEPFFTTKGVGLGTGLGLSISYGIIQQHKGTIEVESEVNGGTCFTIQLPLGDGP